jgi:hypothetical protein
MKSWPPRPVRPIPGERLALGGPVVDRCHILLFDLLGRRMGRGGIRFLFGFLPERHHTALRTWPLTRACTSLCSVCSPSCSGWLWRLRRENVCSFSPSALSLGAVASCCRSFSLTGIPPFGTSLSTSRAPQSDCCWRKRSHAFASGGCGVRNSQVPGISEISYTPEPLSGLKSRGTCI